MRMVPRVVVVFCLFLLLGGSPKRAHAWGNTWMGAQLERLVNTVRRSVGPFRIDADLSVSNAGYDSNLYYGSKSDPVADYTVHTGLPIRLYLPLKRKVVFEIGELPQYAYYAQTDKERGWNNFFQGGVHFVFRDVYLYLGGGLTNARQRVSSETDVNVRRRQGEYGGALHWQLSRRISSSIQFNQARYDYEDIYLETSSISETLDRTESTAGFTCYYQPLSEARLFLSGQYGAFDFTEVSNNRDSQSYEIAGGVEFIGMENLQGIVNLGYQLFESIEHLSKDYRGFVGNTSLFFRPWRRTRFQALLQRDLVFSAYADLAYFIQTLYGGGVYQSLSRRVTVGYNLHVGRNDYPFLSPEGGDPGMERTDNYLIHSLVLNLRLSRSVELSLEANFRKRDSTESWADDQKYFWGFNLVYAL